MKRTNLITALLIFFMAAGISNAQFVRKGCLKKPQMHHAARAQRIIPH